MEFVSKTNFFTTGNKRLSHLTFTWVVKYLMRVAWNMAGVANICLVHVRPLVQSPLSPKKNMLVGHSTVQKYTTQLSSGASVLGTKVAPRKYLEQARTRSREWKGKGGSWRRLGST
jgi:hypothetical protein